MGAALFFTLGKVIPIATTGNQRSDNPIGTLQVCWSHIKPGILRKILLLSAILASLLGASSCTSEKAKKAVSNPVHELPEGKLVEKFWKNGRLLERGHVVNGKYEGVVEQWWEDGTLISRKKFRHSVLVDTMLFWHGNGKLNEMIILEEGNPVWTQTWRSDGMLSYQSIRAKDSTYHISRWDEEGRLTEDRMQIYPKAKLEQYPPENGKMDE